MSCDRTDSSDPTSATAPPTTCYSKVNSEERSTPEKSENREVMSAVHAIKSPSVSTVKQCLNYLTTDGTKVCDVRVTSLDVSDHPSTTDDLTISNTEACDVPETLEITDVTSTLSASSQLETVPRKSTKLLSTYKTTVSKTCVNTLQQNNNTENVKSQSFTCKNNELQNCINNCDSGLLPDESEVQCGTNTPGNYEDSAVRDENNTKEDCSDIQMVEPVNKDADDKKEPRVCSDSSAQEVFTLDDDISPEVSHDKPESSEFPTRMCMSTSVQNECRADSVDKFVSESLLAFGLDEEAFESNDVDDCTRESLSSRITTDRCEITSPSSPQKKLVTEPPVDKMSHKIGATEDEISKNISENVISEEEEASVRITSNSPSYANNIPTQKSDTSDENTDIMTCNKSQVNLTCSSDSVRIVKVGITAGESTGEVVGYDKPGASFVENDAHKNETSSSVQAIEKSTFCESDLDIQEDVDSKRNTENSHTSPLKCRADDMSFVNVQEDVDASKPASTSREFDISDDDDDDDCLIVEDSVAKFSTIGTFEFHGSRIDAPANSPIPQITSVCSLESLTTSSNVPVHPSIPQTSSPSANTSLHPPVPQISSVCTLKSQVPFITTSSHPPVPKISSVCTLKNQVPFLNSTLNPPVPQISSVCTLNSQALSGDTSSPFPQISSVCTLNTQASLTNTTASPQINSVCTLQTTGTNVFQSTGKIVDVIDLSDEDEVFENTGKGRNCTLELQCEDDMTAQSTLAQKVSSMHPADSRVQDDLSANTNEAQGVYPLELYAPQYNMNVLAGGAGTNLLRYLLHSSPSTKGDINNMVGVPVPDPNSQQNWNMDENGVVYFPSELSSQLDGTVVAVVPDGSTLKIESNDNSTAIDAIASNEYDSLEAMGTGNYLEGESAVAHEIKQVVVPLQRCDATSVPAKKGKKRLARKKGTKGRAKRRSVANVEEPKPSDVLVSASLLANHVPVFGERFVSDFSFSDLCTDKSVTKRSPESIAERKQQKSTGNEAKAPVIRTATRSSARHSKVTKNTTPDTPSAANVRNQPKRNSKAVAMLNIQSDERVTSSFIDTNSSGPSRSTAKPPVSSKKLTSRVDAILESEIQTIESSEESSAVNSDCGVGVFNSDDSGSESEIGDLSDSSDEMIDHAAASRKSKRKKMISHSTAMSSSCSSSSSSKQGPSFSCFLCEKTFSDNSKLKTHFKKHITEVVHSETQADKKYSCVFCNKLSYSKDAMRVHIREKHFNVENSKSYDCVICTLSFTTPDDLEIHNQIVHIYTRDTSTSTVQKRKQRSPDMQEVKRHAVPLHGKTLTQSVVSNKRKWSQTSEMSKKKTSKRIKVKITKRGK